MFEKYEIYGEFLYIGLIINFNYGMNSMIKHFSILSTRYNQNKELSRIAKKNNELLNLILESFFQIKKSSFRDEDIKAFNNCENYRKQLLADVSEVSYEVFGDDRVALVKDICKKASSTSRWGQFIYCITKKIESPFFLEIGTNVGVSGAYILEALKGKKNSKFISMEGVSKLCEISSRQFSKIVGSEKFEVRQGLYQDTFPILIKENLTFNILFIDGNHRKEPTIQYFQQLKSKILNTCIFILDDINWSQGMKEAWAIIRDDVDVSFSIDLYKLGIIIIDKDEPTKNNHFRLHLTY